MGMRIGGAFPFNSSGAFPVSLTGGQVAYLPPGNWLMTLGGQTVLQWWDPIQYNWRNIAQPNAETFQISTDGYNWRLLNASGIVAAGGPVTAGSAGTNGIGPTQTGTTVAFAAGSSNTGGTAKGYAIVGGTVGAPAVTNTGSGFEAIPLVIVDPPPAGGIQATATVSLTTAGKLSAVTMVNSGAGYLTYPNFYIVPQFATYPGAIKDDPYGTASAPGVQYFPPGLLYNLPPQNWGYGLSATPSSSGALLSAGTIGGSATLTGVVVTQHGYGYTSVPAITFAGNGSSFASTAIMSWSLTALTGGSGVAYTVGNVWESSMGYLTPATTNFGNNNLFQPRPARGVLTSTVGALSIEDSGFGFQKVLVAGNFGVAQGTSIATTSIAFSAIAMGGVTDTSILQAMVD